MMRRIFDCRWCLILAGALTSAGCGHSVSVPPTTLPVTGKVIYKGDPLAGGKIQFEPQAAGREAFGTIQQDGTFTLSTYGEGDGAVPGSHRVLVTGLSKGSKAVPKKYQNYESSKLELEVSPEKSEYTIVLE